MHLRESCRLGLTVQEIGFAGRPAAQRVLRGVGWMIFDLRAVESDRISVSAAKAGLGIRYTELSEGVHHYNLVREYKNETLLLAQRLSADEAIAFLEGYRFRLDSRRERDGP